MKKVVRWSVVAFFGVGTLAWMIYGMTANQPLPWLNWLMVFPVVAASVVPITLVFTSGPSKKDFDRAPVGLGTVLGVNPTGVTVNGMPQIKIILDVATESGEKIQGAMKKIAGPMDREMLIPGYQMPVRYLVRPKGAIAVPARPEDDERLYNLRNQAEMARGALTPEELRIVQNGYSAQAVVMSMVPTGEVRGGDAVIQMDLRVTRPDTSIYETRVSKAVPQGALYLVQVGSVVKVKYFPGDELNVVVETPRG